MGDSQLRMKQQIGDFTFEGPYPGLGRVPEREGLYAVVCSDQRQHYLLDVGYSKNVKRTLRYSPRRKCWEKNTRGPLSYAFLTDDQLAEQEYMVIEANIRSRFRKIPCGSSR